MKYISIQVHSINAKEILRQRENRLTLLLNLVVRSNEDRHHHWEISVIMSNFLRRLSEELLEIIRNHHCPKLNVWRRKKQRFSMDWFTSWDVWDNCFCRICRASRLCSRWCWRRTSAWENLYLWRNQLIERTSFAMASSAQSSAKEELSSSDIFTGDVTDDDWRYRLIVDEQLICRRLISNLIEWKSNHDE